MRYPVRRAHLAAGKDSPLTRKVNTPRPNNGILWPSFNVTFFSNPSPSIIWFLTRQQRMEKLQIILSLESPDLHTRQTKNVMLREEHCVAWHLWESISLIEKTASSLLFFFAKLLHAKPKYASTRLNPSLIVIKTSWFAIALDDKRTRRILREN